VFRFGTAFLRGTCESANGSGRTVKGSFGGLIALLALLAVACYGCGMNSSPKTAAAVQTPVSQTANASFDPCMLFPKDDAAHILGSSVDVQPEIMAPLCHYGVKASASKDKATPVPAGVENEILVAVGKSDDARSYINLDRTDAKKQSNVANVQGIGDEAFTIALSSGKAIVVAKGDTVYSITLIYPSMAKQLMQDNLLLLAKHAQQTIVGGVRTLATPHPDPCGLVTGQEARHMLADQPIHSLTTLNSAGVASCDYISSQGTAHRVQVISLTRQGAARALYENASASIDAKSKKAVTGIGDQAFVAGENTIWVLKGNTFMHMSIQGTIPANDLITTYAKQAVTRF
jgi:hypothetical protein